jgi:deoxyribodipyrimidine photo-lyase
MTKLNIFIHHRDLRIIDNTTLIEQDKNESNVIPIFIFPPEQINPKKNEYFSNASVQFMIESLHELSDDIKNKNGKIYFFKGDNLKVLKNIHKNIGINSIGYNIDYTPYAKKRDNEIRTWCNDQNIKLYEKEDYVLYDILEGQTLKKDNTPYQVFTPFKNFCLNNLKINEVNKFSKFKFTKNSKLEDIKYNINEKEIDNFYEENININVHGGRSNGLKILNNLDKFKDYQKKRDTLSYKTTFLAAHNHFTTVSIREVYYKILSEIGKNSGLINQLHWRDFYINISHYFPHILNGQIGKKNKAFKEKYDNINWSYNKEKWNTFMKGETGFPIIDAGVRQLLTHNFVHNRVRMVHGNFVTKDLHMDWRDGEKFYSNNLVDIDVMVNNNSWQWCAGSGTDAQPYFRIFNPWTQLKTYDPELKYVREMLPELKDVPNEDIINWWKPEIHNKWLDNGVKYFKPMLDHSIESKKAIEIYKKAL